MKVSTWGFPVFWLGCAWVNVAQEQWIAAVMWGSTAAVWVAVAVAYRIGKEANRD